MKEELSLSVVMWVNVCPYCGIKQAVVAVSDFEDGSTRISQSQNCDFCAYCGKNMKE